jgi:hypothetical protein
MGTPKRSWTDDEIFFLKANYLQLDNTLLAAKLNRHRTSITTKMRELGLIRSSNRGLKRNGHQFINYSHWETNVDTPCCLLMPCGNCKELKTCDDFYILGSRKKYDTIRKGRKDMLGNFRGITCKDCNVSNYKQQVNETKLLWGAKKRSNMKGRECNIDVNDIDIPKRCPILGIELKENIGAGKYGGSTNPNAPSLDRVDNRKGYVKQNVAVISRQANSIKGDGELMDFLSIAAFIADFKMGKFNSKETFTPYKEREIDELIGILMEYGKTLRHP